MSEEAQKASDNQHESVPVAAPLIFEQPLNERMRTFLRLDFLYSQALYHNEMQSQWGSRAAMGSLLDILAIAARGDVRADVQKELERHLAQLNVFQSKPGVDSARLRTVMSNLLRLRADLVPVDLTTLPASRIQNSSRPSSIAAPSPAAPANSTCRISSSGSTRPPTRVRDRSTIGWRRCARCATPSPSSCGSRVNMANRARKSRAAACTTSPSNATRRSSWCASRCRRTPGCIRRPAGLTTAARFDCSRGMACRPGRFKLPKTCRSPSPAVLSQGAAPPRRKTAYCQGLTPHVGKRRQRGAVRLTN